MQLSLKNITDYQHDGLVMLPNLLNEDDIKRLREGVEKNMQAPGPYASNNVKDGHTGLFFDDYCNWQRIPEFKHTILSSCLGNVAAQLMQSDKVQLFHDHVLVKKSGTSLATPWHQDSPYYFVNGEQTVSFWLPLDPVNEASLRLVAGSHKWPKPVLPTRWASETNFYEQANDYMPVPDPDKENMDIKTWSMQPGDAVAFHFRTLHGAPGNYSQQSRRVFSVRFVGDDAVYTSRPGPTSPPFPDHGMEPGEPLRQDWFPVVYPSHDQY